MAFIVLPSLDDLWSTGYGLALLMKVALVAVVIVLGAYNRRHLVPAVSAGAAAGPRRRLARIVSVELAMLLAVVGVTSVLVARSPCRPTSAPSPAPTPIPDAVELPLSGGAGVASITVAPGPGRVERDAASRSLPRTAQSLEPDRDADRRAHRADPRRSARCARSCTRSATASTTSSSTSRSPARTRSSVRVRVSDFVAATATTTVEIAE